MNSHQLKKMFHGKGDCITVAASVCMFYMFLCTKSLYMLDWTDINNQWTPHDFTLIRFNKKQTGKIYQILEQCNLSYEYITGAPFTNLV